jgi:hypothetical protein
VRHHAGAPLRGSDNAMTTIYDTDEDGNIMVVFDSRWQFPETLGYSPDDPEYRQLQRMWEEATGRKIRKEDEGNDEAGKRQRQDQ